MPKKNPKHQAQLQRQQVLTKRGKRVYNWKKIGIGLVIGGVTGFFVILGIVYAASQTPGRVVQPGDQVYIYYELTSNGVLKQQSPSADGNLFAMNTGPGGVIQGFYDNVIGMHQGQIKRFTIPGCPTMDCTSYGGYTSGDLAWQELDFFVKIVSFA